jgi:hypothetical protein
VRAGAGRPSKAAELSQSSKLVHSGLVNLVHSGLINLVHSGLVNLVHSGLINLVHSGLINLVHSGLIKCTKIMWIGQQQQLVGGALSQ